MEEVTETAEQSPWRNKRRQKEMETEEVTEMEDSTEMDEVTETTVQRPPRKRRWRK
jgi:hypothetical protein